MHFDAVWESPVETPHLPSVRHATFLIQERYLHFILCIKTMIRSHKTSINIISKLKRDLKRNVTTGNGIQKRKLSKLPLAALGIPVGLGMNKLIKNYYTISNDVSVSLLIEFIQILSNHMRQQLQAWPSESSISSSSTILGSTPAIYWSSSVMSLSYMFLSSL